MILLDTHVVLWWLADDRRLSQRASREIARVDTVLVSPVSCWEIATLEAKGRIALDRDPYVWTADLFDDPQVEPAPLAPQAGIRAGLLGSRGFPGDPADRLLYATARELDVPFLTKDGAIRDFARTTKDVRVVW